MAGAFENQPVVAGGVFEPVEHLVERRSEPVQLVVGDREVQAMVESGGGDRRGLAAHPFDWPEPEIAYSLDRPFWGTGLRDRRGLGDA